jgi:hypoxanthine-DNA glycosylase
MAANAAISVNSFKPIDELKAHMRGVSGFAPIASSGAKLLILGSLPSQLSLQKQQYYGNPQNKFWQLMGELFAAGPALPYAERADRLTACGVAVWDVLRSSVRPGSMDSAIEQSSAVANDFAAFFAQQPDIRLVCFNGQKAAQLFARLVAPGLDAPCKTLRYQTLPSTSPAHASMRFEKKLEYWSILKNATLAG